MAILQVEGIRKSFGDVQVLKGVSFSLEKSQVLSIIGSSGSGKTTLLRCLNFLETPEEGKIYVNDEMLFDADDLSAQKSADIRQKRLHFGLVFQSFNLFPQYTALENVTLAPNLLAKERAKAEGRAFSKKQAMEQNRRAGIALLERVGLGDKLDNYPCQLSGGQCQRVAIARALALEPDILCFDEPTSALDPELTGEVLQVIRELKAAKTTMIVVTHEMEFARNVSDKVIFMADGLVEEAGTPDEVFTNPKSPKTQAFLRK